MSMTPCTALSHLNNGSGSYLRHNSCIPNLRQVCTIIITIEALRQPIDTWPAQYLGSQIPQTSCRRRRPLLPQWLAQTRCSRSRCARSKSAAEQMRPPEKWQWPRWFPGWFPRWFPGEQNLLWFWGKTSWRSHELELRTIIGNNMQQ